MTGKRLKRVSAFIAIAVLAACATSPTGRKQFILPNYTESDMGKMGAAAFGDLKKKQALDNDPKTNAYVSCVARAILTSLPGDEGEGWEIEVFKDDTPNAFALPGKKIGVHSGILSVAKNQHQLATVIGHEVGHVQAHHSAERLSQQTAAQGALLVGAIIAGTSNSTEKGLVMGALGAGVTYGVLMPFSRTQESEADMIGLKLMAKAGFNPDESVSLWENMAAADKNKVPEFLSTHPSDETRMSALNRALAEAEADAADARAQGRRPNCTL
ncbi:MAG: M48 family metallopeptidase [Spongiibacteraceae bacterium]